MSDCLIYFKGLNGQISVYEDRVVIERKGFMAFTSQGLAGTKTIPMSAIQSVQYKPGGAFINGFIQFGILGGKEAKGGVFNAGSDENTVMVREKDNSIAEQVKNYVEKKIFERQNVQGTTVIKQETSPADEILKYKKLADAGIITPEEFEQKKKELLGL